MMTNMEKKKYVSPITKNREIVGLRLLDAASFNGAVGSTKTDGVGGDAALSRERKSPIWDIDEE